MILSGFGSILSGFGLILSSFGSILSDIGSNFIRFRLDSIGFGSILWGFDTGFDLILSGFGSILSGLGLIQSDFGSILSIYACTYTASYQHPRRCHLEDLPSIPHHHSSYHTNSNHNSSSACVCLHSAVSPPIQIHFVNCPLLIYSSMLTAQLLPSHSHANSDLELTFSRQILTANNDKLC